MKEKEGIARVPEASSALRTAEAPRPLPTILERIVTRRRERYGVEPRDTPLAGAVDRASQFGSEGGATGAEGGFFLTRNAFVSSLKELQGVSRAIIAEVKLGSPRLGSLVGRFDPEEQASLYRDAGAAALSVVVEPDFFFGSRALLERCKEASGLPVLAKDFVVHPRQLDEAKAAGADAILLIAALYTRRELMAWALAARERDLAPLVETHDAEDLALLDGAPWELVGVNNRDLRTFEVDLERSIALLPRLPSSAVKIAESGIRGGAEVERLSRAGFDAFLVGESLLTSPDPRRLLAELLA